MPNAQQSKEAALKRLKSKGKVHVPDLQKGILKGDRKSLSVGITLVESALSMHKSMAAELIDLCLPHSGKSIRVGITGVPGVGKSSFIEAFGQHLTEQGHKLAILAIDPSSHHSHGSILGDKTRMELLSRNPDVFIRPTPSSEELGGVARCTREAVILCEAAGYDVILIETVGVGQSEIAVDSMVDYFLLLMLAGAGDELQGIKRGIMEMAHGLVVTKADGDNVMAAKRALTEYKLAVHLLPAVEPHWETYVSSCSAVENKGIVEIWDNIQDYCKKSKDAGFFDLKRRRQSLEGMYNNIEHTLIAEFYAHPEVKTQLKKLSALVEDQTLGASKAALTLVQTFLQSGDKGHHK